MKTHRDRDSRGGGHVMMMEAETWCRTANQGLLASTGSQEEVKENDLAPSEIGPPNILILDFWPLELWENTFSVFGIQFHHFMADRWGKNGNTDRLFSWAPKSVWTITAAMKLKNACFFEEKFYKPRQHTRKQPTKVSIVKTIVFPVVMYRCESWTINKAEH